MKKPNYLSIFILPLLSLDLAADDAVVQNDRNESPYRLIWEEDFSGSQLDLNNWNRVTGDGCPELCGWGNNELQIYNEESVSVQDGFLRIEATRVDSGYESARITTEGKVKIKYGRVEFRARLPYGKGVWPAVWMLPLDQRYGGWPLSGEIDILEAYNLGVDDSNRIQSVLHYGYPWPDNRFSLATYTSDEPVYTEFHTYALEWQPQEMRFYVNGQHFATIHSDEWFTARETDNDFSRENFPSKYHGTAPFDQEFYLVINLAIGGNLPGAPDSNTRFPQLLEVDYVRFFECVFPSANERCETITDPNSSPASTNTH